MDTQGQLTPLVNKQTGEICRLKVSIHGYPRDGLVFIRYDERCHASISIEDGGHCSVSISVNDNIRSSIKHVTYISAITHPVSNMNQK